MGGRAFDYIEFPFYNDKVAMKKNKDANEHL